MNYVVLSYELELLNENAKYRCGLGQKTVIIAVFEAKKAIFMFFAKQFNFTKFKFENYAIC
jgi:hypothetical protein